MYLKRLEIHGFKSFAQKTTLEFSSGVIAVVGPNGSGKSNVADCLRWVLGEQSAKMIRGKKSDDVIFAGSDKKGKMGFAEVFATFDNKDKKIPLDAAEVSIGRRIDRSGQSEYLINGQTARLLDVVDLVLKSNIGTSRYTVIGQGTIDQMILAGPSEVKNLLDEASGVKSYYIKREKTLRRLEQTAQNLMRAEDLIGEIAPRLRSLRRQAKRMEERAAVEADLKGYLYEHYSKSFWQFQEQLAGIQTELSATLAKEQSFETEVLRLQKLAQTEESSKSGSFGQYRQIQNELTRLQNAKNRLLEDMSLVRGKMQSQKTSGVSDTQTLHLELHQLKAKEAELVQRIEVAESETADQNAQIAKTSDILKELNSKLDKLYEFLQNPNTVDWEGFNRQLVVLDISANEFYGKISAGRAWEEVRPAIEAFWGNFRKFKEFVGKSFRDPQAAANLQAELKKLLREKEELVLKLQDLELGVSKNRITLEFLQKQKQDLSQEKLRLELELKKNQTGSFDDFVKDLMQEEKRIQTEVSGFSVEIEKLQELFKQEQQKQEEGQKNLRELENLVRHKQSDLYKTKDEVSKIQVDKAKIDTQAEVLKDEIVRILGEAGFLHISQNRIESKTPDLDQKIAKLKNQIENIGGMDELTMKEYQETEERYQTLGSQVEDLKKSMNDLRQIMDDLDGQIKTKFSQAFHQINAVFENYFRLLFNGGRATLSLVRADDVKEESGEPESLKESEGNSEVQDEHLRPEEKIVKKYEHGASNIIGVDIKATPPGKKLSSLQALSGGERSLTSIALLCSLLTCFPSPFVVLDEVDAALDDANTIRFGQIIGKLAHQTQFITITHNRETMAQASMLYGVTMGDDGVSKLLSVKLEQAKQFAK